MTVLQILSVVSQVSYLAPGSVSCWAGGPRVYPDQTLDHVNTAEHRQDWTQPPRPTEVSLDDKGQSTEAIYRILNQNSHIYHL